METAPKPQLSLQDTLGNLAEIYSRHRAGKRKADDPWQVKQSLTSLYQGLRPEHRKDPHLAVIVKKCGPLAIDPDTEESLIHDPQMLDLIYPHRHRKPKSRLKTRLALGTVALGAAAVGTAGVLLATEPNISDYIHHIPTTNSAGLPTTTATPKPETPTPVATQTAVSTATATSTATNTATPTVEPAEIVKKEFGDINIAEYFLGDLSRILKERRLEKARNDPAYAERVSSEFLNSNSINILYLGIDDTRERPQEFNPRGWGRSDITMLITFDPKTFQMNAISFPRDMFAPELTSFRFTGGARINSATMAPFVDPSVDSFKLTSRIIESATGMPVDFAFKTNIDFMQGYPGYPGFFDAVFPDGLPIRVPYEIRDNEYPTANYGSKRLVVTKGDHVMSGRELTEFGRSRHETSDFDRSERQRLILFAAFKQLLPGMFKDFVGGKTDTLDRVISALEKQQEYTNLSSDLDIIEVTKTIKRGVEQLRQDPKGIATLALLSTNSSDAINRMLESKDTAFNSLGLTRANGLVANVGANELFYWPYMLKVTGSDTASTPTKLGNHLKYWQPIRQQVLRSVLR